MKYLSVGLAALLAATLSAHATPITYSLDQIVGAYSAHGTVTTNGALGVLSGTDLVSFTMTVSDGVATHSYNTGQLLDFGSDLGASATGLYFNYGDTGPGGFAMTDSTSANILCYVSAGATCSVGVNGSVQISVNSGHSDGERLSGVQLIGSAVSGAAITPEPNSLLLLATGAIGSFAVLRRRLTAS